MKYAVLFLFLIFTAVSSYAQSAATWPQEPKSGAVVIRGSAVWPASTKTEAQRQVYVQEWYLSNLTSAQPEIVKRSTADDKKSGSSMLLTYADLPRATVLHIDSTWLVYNVDIKPAPNGFTYRLSDFEFQDAADQHYTIPVALKDERHQQALAAFRKRLADAQAALR
jgi:hypothetical protein